MNLAELPSGAICTVTNINATDKLLQKLLDMGFVTRAKIEVIREAPLHDPMELRIKNYTLALRKSEAALIEVETQ